MSKRYLSVADTAKLLRQALKAAHPGTKFSVRSSSYAGGASITVAWVDGPTASEVDRTAQLYRGATFDGMTDMKSYHDTILTSSDGSFEAVHFGADFVFVERKVSPALVDACRQYVKHNGHDSRPSQCHQCGTWAQPGPRWVAVGDDTGADFCCSETCAAERTARYWNAQAVTA